MNQQQALEVLVNAVKVAQRRGAFELEETPIIAEAVKVFSPKTPSNDEATTEETTTSEES
jgi:hypothetical protein